MPKLAEVATKHCTPEKIVRIMLAACSRNPKLLECSRESVMLFCMKCSETGLAPIGPGGSWPVPYKNNKTNKVEMQFIPDYRGMVNCAKRAGCITDAYAEVVKENDEFEYTLGLTPSLEHKPAKSERGKMVNAYCVFSLPDGTKRFTLMDKEEIEGIRKRSKAATSGPWVTDESEMWKKTVVRRAMKPFAGMSAELDAALEADNAATGLVEREPIAMPKAKTIDAEVKENPPNEPEAGNTAGDDHTAIPPAQPSNESTIKADLIQAIKARRKADVLKFNTVCSELKIGSKEWENESVDSLVILNERLRGKKSA
jgi:recombination protein RecT